MPEQPEIHWLGWVLLGAMVVFAWILIGAFRAHKKMMAEEERYKPTHRRTYPKL